MLNLLFLCGYLSTDPFLVLQPACSLRLQTILDVIRHIGLTHSHAEVRNKFIRLLLKCQFMKHSPLNFQVLLDAKIVICWIPLAVGVPGSFSNNSFTVKTSTNMVNQLFKHVTLNNKQV